MGGEQGAGKGALWIGSQSVLTSVKKVNNVCPYLTHYERER